nr:hypothetical protein GCM10020063_053050 [Dactylosporangium thailandense]
MCGGPAFGADAVDPAKRGTDVSARHGTVVGVVRVMDDPGEVAVALRGPALDGHPVERGLGDTMLVEGVVPARVLESWRAARSVVALTGRWPVLTGVGELYHEPEPHEIAVLERAARAVDPWSIYRNWGDDDPVGPNDLYLHVGSLGYVNLAARAERELPLPTTRLAVERWLWETIVADPDLIELGHGVAAHYVGTRTWYTPRDVQLVLLPTPDQWLAPLWVSYYAAARPDGPAGLAAAIRQWERHCGAELVACWTTMLQFVVARPPTLGPDAWRLAKQLKAVGGSLQMPPWALALAVTRSDAWFLHDRP